MIANGRTIYGANTGVGGFADRLIPMESASRLQANIISAVATNVGPTFDPLVVRAIMIARTNSPARGGVRDPPDIPATSRSLAPRRCGGPGWSRWRWASRRDSP